MLLSVGFAYASALPAWGAVSAHAGFVEAQRGRLGARQRDHVLPCAGTPEPLALWHRLRSRPAKSPRHCTLAITHGRVRLCGIRFLVGLRHLLGGTNLSTAIAS